MTKWGKKACHIMFGLKISSMIYTPKYEFITKSLHSLRFMKLCHKNAINKQTGKALLLPDASNSADIQVRLQCLLIPFFCQMSLHFSPLQITGGLTVL